MQAAREAVGPDVHIMLDANNAWSNLEDALRYMAAYEPFESVLDGGTVLAGCHQSARQAGAAHRRPDCDWRD